MYLVKKIWFSEFLYIIICFCGFGVLWKKFEKNEKINVFYRYFIYFLVGKKGARFLSKDKINSRPDPQLSGYCKREEYNFKRKDF